MSKRLKQALKKTMSYLAVASMFGTTLVSMPSVATYGAVARQMEALDRGLVATKVSNGVYLSWRLLGTDEQNVGFYIYKNGTRLNSTPLTASTNYVDASGKISDKYYVTTVIDDVERTKSAETKVLSQNYLDIPLNKPASMKMPDGSTCTYSANDASVGDVDGDGQYEIILKWDPSNSKDNSQKGYTGNVYLDAYEMDGTQLWRIDLGRNIRAGAHYTQFMVYDLDGDGKAEVACKTSDGTVDGRGLVIGNANADYRNSSGYILTGNEYLTVFSGQTGEEITTIDYTPARGSVSSWGDKYGNRVDRFLACIAYLDGKTPSLVMCRGYYTRAVLVAYDFDGNSLKRKWTFDSNASGNSAGAGQGNHNLSVADVDNDGYDEIIYGSATIDHNGKLLYATGLGHGDAMHVTDLDPDREGLEVFQVHEGSKCTEVHDAATGEILWKAQGNSDIGRGIAGNFGSDYYPYIAMSTTGSYDKNGKSITAPIGGYNFAIWWDGDLYREVLDKNYINKYNGKTHSSSRYVTFSGVTSCNSTKATPSLQADLFGDWREEVMYPLTDSSALRIFMTTDVTSTRFYTFMHDPVYRLGIAWQNVAYNQPPHTSFYIGPNHTAQPAAHLYTPGNYTEPSIGSSGNNNQGTTVKPGATLEDGATYMIKNVKSGLYLDVAGGVAANGTNVQQWGAAGAGGYNSWKVVAAGNGYYKIYSGVGDGSYLLDVANNSKDSGTNIGIWQATNCDAQLFKFYDHGDGTYGILTKTTTDGSCLDVAAGSSSNGANIQQWGYAGSTNQRWVLEKVISTTDNGNKDDDVSDDDGGNSGDTAISGNIEVSVSCSGGISTNTVNPSISIKATSGANIDTSKLKVRYYYTADGTTGQSVWLDTAAVMYNRDPWYSDIKSGSNVSVVKMPSSQESADSFIEFTFTEAASLQEGDTLSLTARAAKNDWSNFEQSNDYSYNDSEKVAVYYNNQIISGSVPQ